LPNRIPDRDRKARCRTGPNPAVYDYGKVEDRCSFNSLFSTHPVGGNFCLGDGSVRMITYNGANAPSGATTILEALSSRGVGEAVSGSW
jgi:hypothetical protein